MQQQKKLSNLHPFKVGGGVIKDGQKELLEKIIGKILQSVDKDTLPVIVVSAFSGVTNKLEEVWRLCLLGNEQEARQLFRDILNFYVRATGRLATNHSVLNSLAREIYAYENKIGFNFSTDPLRSNLAYISSIGERISCQIIYQYLLSKGFKVEYVSALEVVRATPLNMDSSNAVVAFPESADSIFNRLSGVKNKGVDFVLTEGFIGGSSYSDVVTLGREGSDLTGVLFASCTSGRVTLIKDLDYRPLRSCHLIDLSHLQNETGSHLVGEQAINAAIEQGVSIEVLDLNSSRSFLFD